MIDPPGYRVSGQKPQRMERTLHLPCGLVNSFLLIQINILTVMYSNIPGTEP